MQTSRQRRRGRKRRETIYFGCLDAKHQFDLLSPKRAEKRRTFGGGREWGTPVTIQKPELLNSSNWGVRGLPRGHKQHERSENEGRGGLKSRGFFLILRKGPDTALYSRRNEEVRSSCRRSASRREGLLSFLMELNEGRGIARGGTRVEERNKIRSKG